MLDHGISVHLIHTRLIHHLRVSNLRRILITKHLGLGQILNGIASLETFLNWCVCRTHIKIAIWWAAIGVNSSCLRSHRLSDDACLLRFLIHVRNNRSKVYAGRALPSWVICLRFHFDDMWWLYHRLLQLPTRHCTGWGLRLFCTAHFVHVLAHGRWAGVLLHHTPWGMLSTVHLLFLGVVVIGLQLLARYTL